VIAAIMLTLAVVAVQPALAGMPVTDTVTLGASTGTAAYTNAWVLKGAKLISVEYFGGLNTTNVITVTRVRGTRTNTVCAVTLVAGAGLYSATNTYYSFRGDVLNFSSLYATGTTAELTFELQP